MILVLCLDECPTNVVTQTAAKLKDAISRECKGLMVITIAHHISIILHMDNVLVLDQGVLTDLLVDTRPALSLTVIVNKLASTAMRPSVRLLSQPPFALCLVSQHLDIGRFISSMSKIPSLMAIYLRLCICISHLVFGTLNISTTYVFCKGLFMDLSRLLGPGFRGLQDMLPELVLLIVVATPHCLFIDKHNEFLMTDLGPLHYSLGISISRDDTSMFLCQRKYALEILESTDMLNCQPCRTPVDTSLNSTGPVVLLLDGPPLDIVSFLETTYCPAPLSDRLSRSSVEAGYRGVANVVAETTWLHNLLRELHTLLARATLVYCDNVSAMAHDKKMTIADVSASDWSANDWSTSEGTRILYVDKSGADTSVIVSPYHVFSVFAI
ncbi:ribonuclease H-like domain-containing protein [Tanacetum coccineum]